MTNKLLKKYSVDIFFILLGVVLILSILESASIVDIAYFGCSMYYYLRVKIYRWKKCH